MLSSFLPSIHLSDCQDYLALSELRLHKLWAVGNKVAWKDECYTMGTATPGYLESLLFTKNLVSEAKDLATGAFSPREYHFEMI